jgi:fructose-specific phosphotransferase system component IIB
MTEEQITQQDITKAAGVLLTAAEVYENNKKELDFAQRAEIDAQNKLNEAQKEFDSLVGRMRACADRDSNWGREKDEARC